MKKVINDPRQVVPEMLEGLCYTQNNIRYVQSHNVIVRADIEQVRKDKVTLISGGGSGHEPAHAGFVGRGMLSAAVCGDVFSSPTWSQVYHAIKLCAGPKGVLLIIKNYTGDILHFSMAAEFAQKEGIKVSTIVVGDDIALSDRVEASRARGIAGTVFVHKIAGALAEQGADLQQVAQVANRVAKGVKTMGVALSPCTIPAVGIPSFTLGPKEIEFGLGIHGEPGRHRSSLDSIKGDEIVDNIINTILPHVSSTSSSSSTSAPTSMLALINNLGSTTNMEMCIIARRLVQTLASKNIVVELLLSGSLMTSLEMSGFSISLLPINANSDDKSLISLLSAETDVAAWPKHGIKPALIAQPQSQPQTQADLQQTSAACDTKVKAAIFAVCKSLIESRDLLTALDNQIGDGDIGVNLEAACRTVISELPQYPTSGPLSQLFNKLTFSLRNYGGSSGAFFSTFFSNFADAFVDKDDPNDLQIWAKALTDGTIAIMKMGGGKKGMKTMLDSLIPAAEWLTEKALLQHQQNQQQDFSQLLSQLSEVANQGAISTKGMTSQKGRSQYLGEKSVGVEDPGSRAVAIAFQSIAQWWKTNHSS